VVATLVAHRLPVVRDHAPSWTEQADAVRWHRGPVVRILVDPAPDHWRICAARGRGTVVVHSGPPDQSVTMAALRHGVAAVVPADHVEERLVPIVGLVAQGYLVVDQRFSRPVLQYHDSALDRPALTGREYDILQSIGRSHTIRQTARSLGIAVKTVENTQGHLFRKLRVHNRAEALAAAYSLGLLHPRSRQ
jgi:DNA-binding NarL/FixJ family response regulator